MKKSITDIIKEWIDKLDKLIDRHWKRLDKYGYVKYPKVKEADCFGIYFKGNYFEEHHEGNAASGALMILKQLLKEVEKNGLE